eukprot:SAG22_NODE_866_length_6778_cov_2.436592_2_plen_1026_part_00
MDVMRQGWIEKSSGGKSGLKAMRKDNWQKRWFVLHGGPEVSQPRIVYYKDDVAFKSDAEASGQVGLRGAVAVMTTVMNPAMMGGDERVSFEVQAAQRTLPLRVGADDAQEWINAINQAVSFTKAQRRQRRTASGGGGAGGGSVGAGGGGAAAGSSAVRAAAALGPSVLKVSLPRTAAGFGMNLDAQCNVPSFSGAGTVAEASGVPLGSKVLSVNGVPVSTKMDIVAEIGKTQLGDAVEFELQAAAAAAAAAGGGGGGVTAGGPTANPAMGANTGPIMNPAQSDDGDTFGPAQTETSGSSGGPVMNPFNDVDDDEADAKTLADFDDLHVFKKGWLLKRSGGSGGGKLSMGEMRAKWDRRYFVLHKARLRYYKTPDDGPSGVAERGSCSLAKVQISEYSDADKNPNRARFKLRAREPDGSERLFTLEAPKLADMEDWIEHIEYVGELHAAKSQAAVGSGGAGAGPGPSAGLDGWSPTRPPPAPPGASGGGGASGPVMNPFNDDTVIEIEPPQYSAAGGAAPGGGGFGVSAVANPLAMADIDGFGGGGGGDDDGEPVSSAEGLRALDEKVAALKAEIEGRNTRVYHEGYLLKKSGGQGEQAAAKQKARGMAKALEKWDRRYFVMKHRRLFYYKDQAAFRAQNEPRGSCNMRGVVVIPRAKQDGKPKWQLKATEPDRSTRVFSVQAADRAELERWVGMLEQVLASHAVQKQAEAALKALGRRRAAAVLELEATGVAVEPEPEPETSFVAAHMAAPEIAIKMKGKHLAALIEREGKQASPLKQGWLLKQSGNVDGRVGLKDKGLTVGNLKHSWDRRWFVMQHHFMFYFDKQQDFEAFVPPKGAIPVADAKVHRDAHAADPAVRCTFYVDAKYGDGRRTFGLKAGAEEEALDWIVNFNQHVQQVDKIEAEAKQHEEARSLEGGGDLETVRPVSSKPAPRRLRRSACQPCLDKLPRPRPCQSVQPLRRDPARPTARPTDRPVCYCPSRHLPIRPPLPPLRWERLLKLMQMRCAQHSTATSIVHGTISIASSS